MSELNQKEVNEQMYLFVKQWIDNMTFEESKKVPVMAIAYCLARLSKQDELLKEQEAVKPYIAGSGESFETAWWYECGNCNKPIDPNDKFCRHCGRAVKWE